MNVVGYLFLHDKVQEILRLFFSLLLETLSIIVHGLKRKHDIEHGSVNIYTPQYEYKFQNFFSQG